MNLDEPKVAPKMIMELLLDIAYSEFVQIHLLLPFHSFCFIHSISFFYYFLQPLFCLN